MTRQKSTESPNPPNLQNDNCKPPFHRHSIQKTPDQFSRLKAFISPNLLFSQHDGESQVFSLMPSWRNAFLLRISNLLRKLMLWITSTLLNGALGTSTSIFQIQRGRAPRAWARSSSHWTWRLLWLICFNAQFPICCYGHSNQVLESLSPGLYGPPPNFGGLYLPAVPLLTSPSLYERLKSA